MTTTSHPAPGGRNEVNWADLAETELVLAHLLGRQTLSILFGVSWHSDNGLLHLMQCRKCFE